MKKKSIILRKPNEEEQKRKAICLEQLSQDRQKLLMRWPFLGSIIMRMELVPVRDDRLQTASTNGDCIFVDINFYSKLTREERHFVLAHEVWHSVLLHFARRGKRNHERFNIAADLEIHFTLKNEKMSEPYVLPHNPSWEKLSAEEIYERLPQKLEEMSKLSIPAKISTSFAKDNNGNSSFDKHLYKGDQLSPDNMSPNDGNGNGNENDDASDENVSNDGDASDGKAVEFVADQDYTPTVPTDSVERSRARTIAAVQQMERMRKQGKLPANITKLLELIQKPSLPWQEMLKQFVTTCYGGKRRWLPPSRRHVWQNLYLPSLRGEMLQAVVALDTSGSTAGDIDTFFAELLSLMKSFGRFSLDVIQCDAVVQSVEHFSDANPPLPGHKWVAKGGGGTNFIPVFDYVKTHMAEKPDLLIFFTDGYGIAPQKQPGYPVMWVLTHNSQHPCNWGRVVHFK